MIAVALKGLAARKVRALLTAFAVVIGVSMVSGTFILTDTMQRSFDGLFSSTYDKTDAFVEGKEVVKDGTRATVPASVLDRVKALPEVAAAGGQVFPPDAGAADILGHDGKAVAKESVGTGYDRANAQFSPLRLKSGQWPHGGGQVVIDAGTAAKEHLAIGQAVRVSTLGHKGAYRITGTVAYGTVDSLGFASIAAWDLPTAQRLLDRDGRFDSLSIAAKPGTSDAAVIRAVRSVLPAGLVAKSGEQQAKDDARNVNDGLSFIRWFLLGFGGIALLVGAFVIFNTLSITVAQRTREFATLRTLGGSRKQVMRSVKLEGLVLGLVASVIGLVLGLGIAKGMVVLFSAMGVDLPKGSTVVATRTVAVSVLLGTGITLLASIVPARRATRVPPIAAVREGAALPASRLSRHSLTLGMGVLAASAAALAAGTLADGLTGAAVALLMVGGVLGVFVALALLAPRLVVPLARVVGWPARRAGGAAGDLAGANAVRNPGRTASTAAALMIGLTLVTTVAVLGSGLRASTQRAVSDQLTAGYVVDGEEGMPFRAAGGDAVAAVDGVTHATHVRSDKALVGRTETQVTGVDPTTIARFYRYKWSEGSSQQAVAALGRDGALVTHDYAKAHHLAVGGRVAMTSPSGVKRTFVVRGIYAPPKMNPLLGELSIGIRAFDAAFAEPHNAFTLVDAEPRAEGALKAAVANLGDARLHTGAAYPKDATKELATILAMLYVLLGFSVVVSLFGMVNTLVLSVFERTREIGMLRAIGMTRRQARRMIRHESVITALIGAALGLTLGWFLAALATNALSSYGVGLSVPVAELVAFTLVAVLAGIGAAVMPARRASRLNVLEALHYE